jgi:hypothetical protein
MEKVFLAYTYSIKDEYSAQQDLLLKRVRAILDAMNLLEFNGEVLGGGGLTDAIRERIDDCNALLAIILPHSNSSQELQGSKWVNDEFVYAKNQKKLVIRIIHHEIPVPAMEADVEYISFNPNKEGDSLIRLMRTLSLWITKTGRPARFKLQGNHVDQFDGDKGHECFYRLRTDHNESDWIKASSSREPGGLYAAIRGFPEKQKIRFKLVMGNSVSESNSQEGERVVAFREQP